MLFASRAGLTKILVSSGVHSVADVAALPAGSPRYPDVVLGTFGSLLHCAKL